MSAVKTPLVLLILDGYGHSESTQHNAIAAADNPVWNQIWRDSPKTLVATSGNAVGLPEGQMGNSEVGHVTLGAGRIIYQSLSRINKAIQTGDFYKNPAYCSALDAVKLSGKAIHIIGLLSPGGVHSHEDHIFAMLDMAEQHGVAKLYLHAFLDGRDCAPHSARQSVIAAEKKFEAIGKGRIASLIGRFYPLDRDMRWDRIAEAYALITSGESKFTAPSALDALDAAYARGESDEFISATAITESNGNKITVEDGDAIIFMNFRPDRARQITRAFVDKTFDGFERKTFPHIANFVMTTEYENGLDANCAFPPENVMNNLGEVIANAGKSQLRIAETEKYAHVTFFFSGGREALFSGEERVLVPSPKVLTYDLQPEMHAYELTDKLVAAIKSEKYDAIICNYANCDQVGHTGVFDATVKAVEAVDRCLAKILEALVEVDGEVIITADHGNAEKMFDESTGQAHTRHTSLPVPLVYVGKRSITLREGASLADVAPTILDLMGLEQPTEMTGISLIKR